MKHVVDLREQIDHMARRHGIMVTSISTKRLLAYVRWCETQGVDPLRWWVAKHAAQNWARRLPMDHVQRSSSTFRATFDEWRERYASDLIAQAFAKVVKDQRPAGQLVDLYEQYKAGHKDARDVCAIDHRGSGGYNARSPHCQTCMYAAECLEQVNARRTTRHVG